MSEQIQQNLQKCNKCEVLQAKLIDAEASWARQRETLKQVSQNLETQIGSIQSQKESLSAQLAAEQLSGQGLETKISEANATIARLQRELIEQKSSIKNEFEKMIEEQHKLSAANTTLSIKNQSLELKVQNLDQMLEAVRKQLQNHDQQREQFSASRLDAEKKNQQQAAKIETHARQVEQFTANVQSLESEKQRHASQSQTQISSLKQDLAYQKQQVESQMTKNAQLEDQVSQMLAERRSHFTSQSSGQEKVRQMELNERQLKKVIQEKESENERNQTQLSALKKQILEAKKQIGQFALGKLDFNDAGLNQPQLTEIFDRHEDLKQAVVANGQLQETMKGATAAIARLQQQYRECTAKNMKLKQQCLTLQSESSSDRALVMSLNKVLSVRQEEFIDASNKLKQLQNALRDSSHVQAIQDTIRNNSENYQALTKNDKDLITQVDELNKKLIHDQKLSQMTKTENSNLKLQLAELTDQTSKEKLKGSKEADVPMVAAEEAPVKQPDMRVLIQTIENNHHDALVKKTQEIAAIRAQLQEASVRLLQKDCEENKAQSPQKQLDPSIVQNYEQVINSKTQETNSLQIQLRNCQDTYQLVKQQLDNQTSHVEFCKKQANELQEKLATQLHEKAELRNEKTQWIQKEQEHQAGFLDQTEKQKVIIDNLNFTNTKLTEDARVRESDLFKLKISSENLHQVKLQQEKQLSIKEAQINELTIDRKNYVFRNVVEIEIEKVFDAENKIKSLEKINEQHEKDHQSEISKREDVMKQVQQLFGDVESKLAQREAEIEAKNSGQIKRQITQIKKLTQLISDSKEKMLELEDENKSLKEQVNIIEEQKDRNQEIKDAISNQNSVDEQLATQKLKVQLAEGEFQLKEAILEKEKITQQLQQEQKVLYETRKMLSDQIETMSERNKQLEKCLEEEKKAAVLGMQTANDARYTALELKLNAAETESEKQKGTRMLLQAVLEQTQQQKTASEFKLSQANLELDRAKTMLDLNKILVQQLQELNSENKQLKADQELLKTTLDQAQQQIVEKANIINTRLSKPEAQQAILDTKAALFALNQAYTELQAAHKAESQDSQQAPPNNILAAMHLALRRGKQLFLLLQTQLADQQQEPKIEVGQKRPRTSE